MGKKRRKMNDRKFQEIYKRSMRNPLQQRAGEGERGAGRREGGTRDGKLRVLDGRFILIVNLTYPIFRDDFYKDLQKPTKKKKGFWGKKISNRFETE